MKASIKHVASLIVWGPLGCLRQNHNNPMSNQWNCVPMRFYFHVFATLCFSPVFFVATLWTSRELGAHNTGVALRLPGLTQTGDVGSQAETTKVILRDHGPGSLFIYSESCWSLKGIRSKCKKTHLTMRLKRHKHQCWLNKTVFVSKKLWNDIQNSSMSYVQPTSP